MEDDAETIKLVCQVCCRRRRFCQNEGFYYCEECGTQAEGINATGVADEDIDKTGGGGLYNVRSARHTKATPSQPTNVEPDHSSQLWYRFTQELEGSKEITPKKELNRDSDSDCDANGPTEPADFGAEATGKLDYADYYNEVRIRYMMGMQWMIQLQCEALVEKFNVSPLICGVASAVWLRFVAFSGVCKDAWANDTLTESETQNWGEPDDGKDRGRHSNEPRNAYGQRAIMVWFRSLRKAIPLDYSLAICFLACHVAREAVLPTDIVKWSVEGRIPYFAAYVEIEKRFEQPSLACPISLALMFRPSQPVPFQKLEAMAASIAELIGLNLPPVNFYAVASCYLNKLSVPGDKILPHACRIYEWSMPPDLWLSTNELRLPTRVCVMSILIVAIRLLYNINGFGAWEKSLSKCVPSGVRGDADKDTGYPLDEMADSSENFVINERVVQELDFDSGELLRNLEAEYSEMGEPCEFVKDLTSYLRYCNDVVFAGAGSSSQKDQWEEEELIEKLWNFYQNAKDCEPGDEEAKMHNSHTCNQKRSRNNDDGYFPTQPVPRQVRGMSHESPSPHSSNSHGNDSPLQNSYNTDPSEETAIRKLKSDMEENRFCYIPPRVNAKRLGYLQYARKQDEGILRYVAHADYYILLRSCAKVAEVDIRIMHIGVLSLERRLAWLEKRTHHCMHLTPPSITCDFCRDVAACGHDVGGLTL
ncbi:unnamed protein product [Linum tenue]|uniref:Rrn7/TAF1B N-terminal cyclin domain-containing protein n=1 Tax=Linum tenue TaxID=586396 RepID=A0AAV0MMR4_9ROSI|nr:unnamed protein product [Linum tenue]